MLSAINVGWVSEGVTPIVFAVALMSGGIVQLIAGIIQLRTGNTIAGVLFTMYGALWLSLFAYAEFFASEVPPADRGHALGLLLFAFGIFTVWIFVASFRTNLVVVTALVFLAATLFVLGAGKYGANIDLIRAGGWLGLVAGAEAAYLSCAELCQIAYKREALPHPVAGQIANRGLCPTAIPPAVTSITFPRKRLVRNFTRRFRVIGGAMTISAGPAGTSIAPVIAVRQIARLALASCAGH